MKSYTKWIGLWLFILLVAVGCSSDKSASNESEGGVRTIKVAYAQNGIPVTYQDDNGDATGYDVEVLKLIDERLPDYEFEFIPTTDDDLLIGVENGKYHVGVKNNFYTKQRAKKYIYPEENIGASNSGLIVRAADKDRIKDLSGVAASDTKLIPIAPQNAQYNLVLEYNEENPDDPIEVENSETFSVTDWPVWLMEGRYDAMVNIKTSYTATVENEDGAYHHLKNKLAYNTFTATKTYPLFNKKEQHLADAYDDIIQELKEEGVLNEMLVEYLGEDTFKLLEESN